MSDEQDVDLPSAVVNPVDDSPISNAVANVARQPTCETFNVVVVTRIVFQLSETSGQFSRQGLIRQVEERLGFGREDNFKHPIAPCAS
jgi:hypothetical protein